jgi:hypothetical protein
MGCARAVARIFKRWDPQLAAYGGLSRPAAVRERVLLLHCSRCPTRPESLGWVAPGHSVQLIAQSCGVRRMAIN